MVYSELYWDAKLKSFNGCVRLSFMSDSSRTPSGPFTKSPIRTADQKHPSTLSLRSPSSPAPAAKDELIDEYQSKMSDLLRCQQELCSVKAQLEVVQRQEREARQRENGCQEELAKARRRIQELEPTVNLSIAQESQIVALKKECEGLKQIIEEQNRELAQRESNLLKQREAMEILQQTHRNETNELEQRLRQTIRDLKQAKRENSDLQRLHTEANHSITQQRQELDDITEKNEELEAYNKKLKEKKRKLKQQIRHSSDESTVNQTTIAEQHTLIQSLRSQKEKYKEKCADLAKTQAEVVRLGNIITTFETEKDVTKTEIGELERNLAKAVRKNKIASGLFAKIATLVGNPESPKDIVRNVGVLYQEMTELRKQTQRIAELESVVGDLKQANEDFTGTVQKLNQQLSAAARKLRIGQAIERARKAAVTDLRVVGKTFGLPGEDIPLRSVIITVILGMRLRRLERDYVADTRNWWWLSKNTTAKLCKHVMKSGELLINLQEQNAGLTGAVEKLSKEATDTEASKRGLGSQAGEYEQSVQFLRTEIKRLNEELSSLIEPEMYESLESESIERKRSLKRALGQVKSLSAENQHLMAKLEETTFSCQDLTNEIESLHEELATSQSRIEQLSEELQLMQKVQLARTKELLSLERGIKREHVTSDHAAAQCQALAFENRQLFNQMNPQKRERHSGGSVRLGLHSTKTLL
jgi:chromosome segregation ATPase